MENVSLKNTLSDSILSQKVNYFLVNGDDQTVTSGLDV